MEYRLISTKIHGILDYVMGATLMALPALFDFSDKKAAKLIPVFLGSSAIAVSLFTDYELSVKRSIPMKVHLGIDAGAGLLLATSPWLFGFSKKTYLPHLILGVMEVLASVMTKTRPSNWRETLIKDFIVKNKWFGKSEQVRKPQVKSVAVK